MIAGIDNLIFWLSEELKKAGRREFKETDPLLYEIAMHGAEVYVNSIPIFKRRDRSLIVRDVGNGISSVLIGEIDLSFISEISSNTDRFYHFEGIVAAYSALNNEKYGRKCRKRLNSAIRAYEKSKNQ